MSEVRNEDRISKYLSPRIQNMMFAELSPDYLERTNAAEILSGIPVPVGIEGSDAKGAIDLKNIILNMAILGTAVEVSINPEDVELVSDRRDG